jgi:hypothetical protein
MVAVILCTAPGTPHPGYGSTCPQARPATPSPDDGVYHQHKLRPLRRRGMRWPRTRVIEPAPPRCPLRLCWTPRVLISLTSLSTWKSLQLSLNRCSLPLHLAPARCYICTCNKQQQQIISTSISLTYGLISQKHNINQTYIMLNIPRWSNTSPGGNTMFGSPRKSTPA